MSGLLMILIWVLSKIILRKIKGIYRLIVNTKKLTANDFEKQFITKKMNEKYMLNRHPYINKKNRIL